MSSINALTDPGRQRRAPVEVLEIEPPRTGLPLDLRELWRFRELGAFLIWRDVTVRYKQTALGVAWAVLQPLLTMVVFSLFFGRLGRMPSDDLPYPLFVYAGLLGWQVFANALTQTANSLVNNERLMTKVYFPRLIIPLSSTLAGTVDFAFSLIFFGGMMLVFGWPLGSFWWTLPVWLVGVVIVSAAVGSGLAALNVRYRDVRLILPFLTQLWLFATPIAYPVSLVPEGWRALYGLNPLVSLLAGFRWALLGGPAPQADMVLVSLVSLTALTLLSTWYFQREERSFADRV